MLVMDGHMQQMDGHYSNARRIHTKAPGMDGQMSPNGQFPTRRIKSMPGGQQPLTTNILHEHGRTMQAGSATAFSHFELHVLVACVSHGDIQVFSSSSDIWIDAAIVTGDWTGIGPPTDDVEIRYRNTQHFDTTTDAGIVYISVPFNSVSCNHIHICSLHKHQCTSASPSHLIRGGIQILSASADRWRCATVNEEPIGPSGLQEGCIRVDVYEDGKRTSEDVSIDRTRSPDCNRIAWAYDGPQNEGSLDKDFLEFGAWLVTNNRTGTNSSHFNNVLNIDEGMMTQLVAQTRDRYMKKSRATEILHKYLHQRIDQLKHELCLANEIKASQTSTQQLQANVRALKQRVSEAGSLHRIHTVAPDDKNIAGVFDRP